MNHQEQKLPTNLRLTIPKPRQHSLGSKTVHERIRAQLSIHQSYTAYNDTFTPNISLANGKEANTHNKATSVELWVSDHSVYIYTHQTSGTHTHIIIWMHLPKCRHKSTTNQHLWFLSVTDRMCVVSVDFKPDQTNMWTFCPNKHGLCGC